MPSRATIWLVNATQDYSALPMICQQVKKAGRAIHVIYRGQDHETILQSISPGDDLICLIKMADDSFHFEGLEITNDVEIIFLPCVEQIDWIELQQQVPLEDASCLQLLLTAPLTVSSRKQLKIPIDWLGWRAQGELARRILREPSVWKTNGCEFVEALQQWPDPPRWQSVPLRVTGSENFPRTTLPRLTMSSSVLVVISFYGCEEWLHACLTSMNQQTRPPENIVVIDDCSPALPLKFLEPFPNVTLLSTTRNVGPEKILNNIIHATDYEAYMVQDPDDWSSCDRLELSLRAAEQTGADLVGTHEFSIDHLKKSFELGVYPPEVNHAMSQAPGHYLLHCASLISRALALQIGGFDEQLKLGADTDFIVRAWHAGHIINLPSFCVFHRLRAGSLTTDVKTGHQSVARSIEAKFITIRGRRNLELVRTGQAPNVIVKQKEPVDFVHHQGPKLRLSTHDQPGGNPVLTEIRGM